MCPHLNNNFTPAADSLPPAVVCSAESAAGGSDLPVSVLTDQNRSELEAKPIRPGLFRHDVCGGEARESTKGRSHSDPIASVPLSTLAAGNSFRIPHICISCGQTLRAKQDASRVVVYCGYGPCKSKAANEGAFGRTVDEAVDELNARILEED